MAQRLIRDTRSGLPYLLDAGGNSLVYWFLLCGLLGAQGLSAVGIGIPLRTLLMGAVERAADRDLRSSTRLLGRTGPHRDKLRASAIIGFWLQLRWIFTNAVVGLLFGVTVLILTVGTTISLTIPLWWWILPEGFAVNPAGYPVDSWPAAILTPVAGLVYIAALMVAVPAMATGHARIAYALLTSVGRAGISVRLAEVTASRFEALEAHGAELRRIERDLHDGTQNRLVAVRMHLGLVERMLRTDPAKALELITTAQTAADDALAELRGVVRSIYPPILADRGLASAVSALAARCPVPCSTRLTELERAPAALEVAAYFVVAESLTNAIKHAGATAIQVELRIDDTAMCVEVVDDGHGGADEASGTGLAGIRRRAAAFDGTTEVASPPGGPTTIRVVLPCGS
ncbi:sensor histidine kinase [Nocardiopsis ansamitocini]|uniref:histidine kinase n=1 Tax=Nocardiopsis ansamitocini TaxID=1670832 RepID=A0A9W6P9N9_9ACTN|nr:histidine kinase [Nocardiopsis ansamitocini]GLU49543.1 histidine kinase [Nocardiopsis ansamitocini]